jgi:cytosine/adenosine deaminase-related metal-dependent hydrolase
MQAYRARYLFPVTSPPLRDAVLTCDHLIRAVGQNVSGKPAVDLGNVAIVPALINAHAHLELSEFAAPLGDPARGFPAWIREVVAWRRVQAQSHSPEELANRRRAAIHRGELESAAAGVHVVGDIASSVDAPQPLHVPKRYLFREILGLRTAREEELFQHAQNFLKSRQGGVGISPHAPYTVGIDLLARLAKLSAQRHVPLAMHLAESAEELELLRSHSGAFYALLTELEAWDPAAFPRGINVLEYLKILAQGHRALVIHGNYLTSSEIDFIAAAAEKLSVVYCPRTHAYFRHSRYPLVELLAKEVNVALGTDSRASNPDLNLWNEMRYVADAFPEISLDAILRMGTVNGADALGLSRCGDLRENAYAGLAIVDLPDDDATDPHELLFDARSQVRSVLAPK